MVRILFWKLLRCSEGDSDESSEDEIGLANLVLPDSSKRSSYHDITDNDFCSICLGTKNIGIVGVGLGFTAEGEDIIWVRCSECQLCYHLLCLGLKKEGVSGVNERFCPNS